MEGAYEDGVLAGIEKGIESVCLGIQMTLESRFNSKGLALMPLIKKIKDLELLKKIMEVSIKCNDLSEVKKLLKN